MARYGGVLFLGVLGLCWPVYCEETNTYEDLTLVRLFPNNEAQIGVLRSIKDEYGDVLKTSRAINDSFDILVKPNKVEELKSFAKEKDVIFEIKQKNYGRSFEAIVRSPRRRILRGFNIFQYNSYSEIQEYLDSIAKQYPDLVTLQTMGNSFQGRRMKLVKISRNPKAGNPIIFVDAGVHAREWVAPAMALYIIHRLTSDREAIRKELNGVDWYILPVVNPDGYEFTRSSSKNRMWRKTRSDIYKPHCVGVDGNRNYGFKWGVSGISNDPCAPETYAGPRPFSEPETKIVRSIMMENAKRLKLYVSIHSYGQYLVYPWGYTGDNLPKEWKKLDNLARKVSDAVKKAGGQPFRVMSAGKWYPAAGGSDDFAFGSVGVPYSYTMELTDGYEFIFPDHLLRKVLPQFYEGFKMFGSQIRSEFSDGN